jgi:hypothetical protein
MLNPGRAGITPPSRAADRRVNPKERLRRLGFTTNQPNAESTTQPVPRKPSINPKERRTLAHQALDTTPDSAKTTAQPVNLQPSINPKERRTFGHQALDSSPDMQD